MYTPPSRANWMVRRSLTMCDRSSGRWAFTMLSSLFIAVSRSRILTMKSELTTKRCGWVSTDPLMLQYHDSEWGVPVHDDRKHFEFLVLEGAQAGLSWSIVLNKREGYRRAFSEFDPVKVARYTEKRLQKLVLDPT